MGVKIANSSNIEDLVQIDREVIGDDHRREFIRMAVEEERCLIIASEYAVEGFLIHDKNFFNSSFISLVIIAPSARRKGRASALLQHFVSIAPTEKVFSSTNLSNQAMKKVFEANGFVQSGTIDNLDDGDPELIYFKMK
ncbi:GNAT family N-acetyltransferase [Anaerobacillus alkaliphilus]|uniref:GNAT family N-acetyltransferase n=1 Tax=Anaerobacillus alkaliphilus TaxID=1548597 RepID=UPI001F4F8774|nr:GNAT family N-acetyltransferase [Anaerobacillus alkaliphilus]